MLATENVNLDGNGGNVQTCAGRDHAYQAGLETANVGVPHRAWGDQDVCLPQDREQNTRLEGLLYHLVVSQDRNNRALAKWRSSKAFDLLANKAKEGYDGTDLVRYQLWKLALVEEVTAIVGDPSATQWLELLQAGTKGVARAAVD